MRFIGLWMLILIVLSAMGVGRMFYQDDNTQDVQNMTSKFEWNESYFESKIENTTNNMNISQRAMIRVKNIIYKGVSNIGFIVFEMVKFGVEMGYTNPDYNYLWFARMIVYALLIIIFLTLLPALPIIIALIYLLVVGIIKGIKKIYSFKQKLCRNQRTTIKQ